MTKKKFLNSAQIWKLACNAICSPWKIVFTCLFNFFFIFYKFGKLKIDEISRSSMNCLNQKYLSRKKVGKFFLIHVGQNHSLQIHNLSIADRISRFLKTIIEKRNFWNKWKLYVGVVRNFWHKKKILWVSTKTMQNMDDVLHNSFEDR